MRKIKYNCSPSVYPDMEELLTIQPVMNASSRKNISTVIAELGKKLFGFIRQRVNTEEDAEDILQDVWYQFTAAVDTEPIEKVNSWLFTVARNKITDRYRKQKPVLLEDMMTVDEDEEIIDFKGILLDDSRNPETEHLRGLFWKTLQESLDELPAAQRDVFVWHELEDISFKEIAERTGETVNTLISRKRYAVLHLRERLLTLYNEIIQH